MNRVGTTLVGSEETNLLGLGKWAQSKKKNWILLGVRPRQSK